MTSFVSTILMGISLINATYFLFVSWIFTRFIANRSLVPDRSESGDPLNDILTDVALILLFIVQHKMMQIFKLFLVDTRFESLVRSILILGASASLQALVTFWAPIEKFYVWDVTWMLSGSDLQSRMLYWTYASLSCIFLLLTFFQALMTDLPLFLGVKQTYYNLMNLGDPLNSKSTSLKRYLDHNQHPVLGILFVLWLRPYMSVDRFILATGMTFYATQFKTDVHDVNYIKSQMTAAQLKFEELTQRKNRKINSHIKAGDVLQP